MSQIVNKALAIALAEDAADLAACENRKNEQSISYQDLIEELKNKGKI